MSLEVWTTSDDTLEADGESSEPQLRRGVRPVSLVQKRSRLRKKQATGRSSFRPAVLQIGHTDTVDGKVRVSRAAVCRLRGKLRFQNRLDSN
jgi:hypothetical protein